MDVECCRERVGGYGDYNSDLYVCMVFGVVWLYVKVLARVDACALCICVGGAVEREDRRSEQIR